MAEISSTTGTVVHGVYLSFEPSACRAVCLTECSRCWLYIIVSPAHHSLIIHSSPTLTPLIQSSPTRRHSSSSSYTFYPLVTHSHSSNPLILYFRIPLFLHPSIPPSLHPSDITVFLQSSLKRDLTNTIHDHSTLRHLEVTSRPFATVHPSVNALFSVLS